MLRHFTALRQRAWSIATTIGRIVPRTWPDIYYAVHTVLLVLEALR